MIVGVGFTQTGWFELLVVIVSCVCSAWHLSPADGTLNLVKVIISSFREEWTLSAHLWIYSDGEVGSVNYQDKAWNKCKSDGRLSGWWTLGQWGTGLDSDSFSFKNKLSEVIALLSLTEGTRLLVTRIFREGQLLSRKRLLLMVVDPNQHPTDHASLGKLPLPHWVPDGGPGQHLEGRGWSLLFLEYDSHIHDVLL